MGPSSSAKPGNSSMRWRWGARPTPPPVVSPIPFAALANLRHHTLPPGAKALRSPASILRWYGRHHSQPSVHTRLGGTRGTEPAASVVVVIGRKVTDTPVHTVRGGRGHAGIKRTPEPRRPRRRAGALRSRRCPRRSGAPHLARALASPSGRGCPPARPDLPNLQPGSHERRRRASKAKGASVVVSTCNPARYRRATVLPHPNRTSRRPNRCRSRTRPWDFGTRNRPEASTLGPESRLRKAQEPRSRCRSCTLGARSGPPVHRRGKSLLSTPSLEHSRSCIGCRHWGAPRHSTRGEIVCSRGRTGSRLLNRLGPRRGARDPHVGAGEAAVVPCWTESPVSGAAARGTLFAQARAGRRPRCMRNL